MENTDLMLGLMQRIIALEANVEKLTRQVEVKPTKARAKIAGFDQSIINMVDNLIKQWPRARADGGPIRNDKVDACSNVVRILKETDATVEELELSCVRWLETKPQYANAIQFYFGPGKLSATPRWKIELAALRTSQGD